jgi:Phosphoesterase family
VARSGRVRRAIGLGAISAAVCVSGVLAMTASASGAPHEHNGRGGHGTFAGQDGLGIKPGKIKHVWLIILENKSYDATFTGLNNNTYLWQTLPSQGVLLKNYYGTGHFSQDNYISLVSGQATVSDVQSDCPDYASIAGSVDTSGSLWTNPNYGQLRSAAGPNAPAGKNGCVYPSSVQTLFNQLDAARVSWKGYAQDLNSTYNGDPNGVPGLNSNSAGVQYCGAPYPTPGAIGTQPSPGAAVGDDQYVPKHFPFPWFESILNSGECNSTHIADLFDPGNGLYHDLQHESTTPAFSWITPDNCSDAHDAVCHGNNLSGGFSGPNTPNPPVNYTGGLYASDLFLEHIVPEIEASPAFRDGGLIDITFDEAFPPFTYTGNSFVNSTAVPPNASTSIADDTAAETLFGRGVHWEPQGPNTPLATDSNGDQLFPGDGYNAFIDRNTSIPGLILGGGSPIGGSATGGARTDSASGAPGSATIKDNAITLRDVGRSVTDATDSGSPIPANCVVADVVDTPVTATTSSESGGFADAGSFTLTCNGIATAPTGTVTKINLGPETAATDPLFDTTHPTNGGGDTGSVLISPYIRPGTVSTRFYNHYSWLRTMEDLFDVDHASRGLDGRGHIGYAAQPGLAPFGRDVFNNPWGEPRDAPGYRLTR